MLSKPVAIPSPHPPAQTITPLTAATDATQTMAFYHQSHPSPSFATRCRLCQRRGQRAAPFGGGTVPLVRVMPVLSLLLLVVFGRAVHAQIGRCSDLGVTDDGLGFILQPNLGCPTDPTVVDGLPSIQEVICVFEQESLSRIFRSSSSTETAPTPPIYRLCPNTTYPVDDNHWLTAVLDGTVYTCGNNGSGDHDDGCVVLGGSPQVILQDNPPEVAALDDGFGGSFALRTVRFEGITFRGATGVSILASGAGNLTVEFVNCRWEESEQAILQGYVANHHGRRTTSTSPESNQRRRSDRRRTREDAAFEALSLTMTPDAILESITALTMTTVGTILGEREWRAIPSDLPPSNEESQPEEESGDGVVPSRSDRYTYGSLSRGGSDADRVRRRVQQDLTTPLGMNTILKRCTIESSPSNATGDDGPVNPDIGVSGGSMEIYGSHFLNGQRDMTFVARDGARVLLKNTNITNSNARVFLSQVGGEAVIDGCLFYSNNAAFEIAASSAAVVTVRDSCFINGTYESVLFGTATSSPESIEDNNYVDGTSQASDCSGLLFPENGTTCLDDGGDCTGECFPFEADSCFANSPTPSPSGSPTMESSMSPSLLPSSSGEWNGTGSVDVGPPASDSSGGSTRDRIHSTWHHVLYILPTIAMTIWMAMIGDTST